MITVNTGYEIQIDNLAMPDDNPLHKTGAIYNLAIHQIQHQNQ